MGMNMSSMGMGFKGVSIPQMLSMVSDKLYDQFVKQDIKDFEGFHRAILEIFSAINTALPGKHYDPPSLKDVTDLFDQFKNEANEEERRKVLTDFMKKKVNMNKVDGSMIMTAVLAPPTGMVVKRTGQTLPQLKLMKSVPDVVFVPTFTVAALVAVKIMKYMFMGKTTTTTSNDATPDDQQQPRPPTVPEPKPPTAPPEPMPPTAPEPAPPQPEPMLRAPAPGPAPPQPEPKPPTAPGEKQSKHAPPNFFCAECNRFHTADEILK